MTGNVVDDLNGTSAAMPQVPLPPPNPRLNHLPTELIENVLKYIPGSHRHELFALHHTCRFFRSVAADFLRPDMYNELKGVRVLMTKDGLTAFLELISVLDWRRCIRCVEFIDPAVNSISIEKHGDACRWLGCPIGAHQLEALENKVRWRCLTVYAWLEDCFLQLCMDHNVLMNLDCTSATPILD
jgi:hypothetical protein